MTSELGAPSARRLSRRTPSSTDSVPPGRDVEVSVPISTSIDVQSRASARVGQWPARAVLDQRKVTRTEALERGPLPRGTNDTLTRVLKGRWRPRPRADRGTFRLAA